MATTEKTFHGLKLLAHCGGGAYGDVYYCEDISGKRLALKVIDKKRLGGAWKRELQGVINYRRITEGAPNLLRILHVAEDDETFYYTMEAADSASTGDYLPDTLAQRLQSGPLPPEQLYPVIRGIFEGIKTIHEAGFAHRDIKPDNILFVAGVPKLGDIGLLSSFSNSATALAGTLEFLPPEVRAADSPESSDRVSRQRSDLYALGKVVYCAATGLEPGNFPTVPTREKLSPALKQFLNLALKLCAKTPERRICDEETLVRELERIEKTRGKTGKLNLPRSLEAVKKFLLTPIPINRHVLDIFKWSCRHAVTIILFLSCVTCYWVLHRYYPELLQKERPPARQTTETGPIPDSGPAKPVEPLPPRNVTEPVKKEISTMKAPVPVEKKPAAPAVKPKPEPIPSPVARTDKTVDREPKRTVEKAKTTRTKSQPSSTALLSWMLRNAPYRKIAEERIAELKKKEDLRKAGKYEESDDPVRVLEEKLWKDAEYCYEHNRSRLSVYLTRLEQIRDTRKAFESAVGASGNKGKPVMPELAAYIGWFAYRDLRNSKRFGKLIMEHEAEVAAERKLRQSGAAVPGPAADVILEKKLWKRLNNCRLEQIPDILKRIEYVREQRGKVPVPPQKQTPPPAKTDTPEAPGAKPEVPQPQTPPPVAPATSPKVFDLSRARTHDNHPLGNPLDFLFKTPKGWGVISYAGDTFRNATTAHRIGAHKFVWIGMDAVDSEKASSYIRMDELDGLTADDFANFSPDRLKKAIRKNLYLDVILPDAKSKLEWKFSSFRSETEEAEAYRAFMERARKIIPEESIEIGDLKTTVVSEHPALYTQISSPLTHQDRRMLYYLVAVKENGCCFSILLDADAKEFELREKQFAEFLKHLDF